MQAGGQVAGFLRHRGFPIPSPAALGRNGNAFRQAMERYAQASGVPWIKSGKDDRKIDVIRPLLEAAGRDGRPGVVAIGVAQEFQWVCAATCAGTSNGIPWFSYYRTERRVTCHYAYVFDHRAGPGFIKICAYAPYRVKVWVTGHEAAADGRGGRAPGDPAGQRVRQLRRPGAVAAPALRPGDPRVQALAGSLAVLGFAVTGITNKSLRAWMTGLPGVPCTMTKASYDLARLSRNGLIARVPHASTYQLTPDGQLFAVFYTKVHDQVLYPVMAGHHIAAPAEVRRALNTIGRHIASLTAAASVRRAA